MKGIALLLFAVLLSPYLLRAQKSITLADAISLAIEHNAGLKASSLEVERTNQLIGSAFDINKTQGYYHFDENNTSENGLPLRVWGVSQSIQFPTVYGAQRQTHKIRAAMQQHKYRMDERLLRKEVSKAYTSVVYWQNIVLNYQYLDSLFQQFSTAASRRYEVGETNYLEKLTASTKQKEVSLALVQALENISHAYLELNKWLQQDDDLIINEFNLSQLELAQMDTLNHPGINYYREALHESESIVRLEKQKLLPELHFSYFQGTNNGLDAQIYQGFQAGMGFPLFFGAQKSRIAASKIESDVLNNQVRNYKKQLIAHYQQLQTKLSKYLEAINFYDQTGKTLSSELIHTSGKAFQNGEIDFVQYILSLESAKNIEMTYLENVYNYNLTVLEINYIMN